VASGSQRVLVVADHLGYPGGVVHGVTTYFLEVLPALARAGVDLTVCYLREPHPAAESLRAHGIEPTFLSAARSNPFVAFSIASLARRHGCSILHAMGIKATLMARIATRLVPARTLLHLHDLVEPGPLVGTLHQLLARRSDMAVCVSAAVAPLAVDRYNVRPDRVRVIHNGIRLDRFTSLPPEARAQLRQSLGLGNETPVLLLAGRMHPIKGHRAMLRMMPAIVRRCPDIVLLLAGDGPERGACEAMAGQLGIDRHLRFLGQRRDVPELLQACDVVVVPSESEGFCLVAVEAFATSRPVVAFDSGGVREVVEDGVTGWVVPAGGENAFVDAVVSLLLDARRRAEFGSRARLAAGQFGIEQHVQRLLDVYRELNGNTADRRIAVPVHGPGH